MNSLHGLDGGEPVPWGLVRSRRRSIGLRVDATGLQVRAPHGVTNAQIERVLHARLGWIAQKWREARLHAQQMEAQRVRGLPGETLLYGGQPLVLAPLPPGRGRAACWEAGEPARLLLPGSPGEAWVRGARRWLQARAREALQACLEEHTQRLGVALPTLRLSDAKGRWGSASSRGTISLHWRLVQLPPALLRHVVAHEVAHLREMNHSPRFWAWVAVLDPDYQASRAALKRVHLPPW